MEYINPDAIVDIYNSVDDDAKNIIESTLNSYSYDIDEIIDEYNKRYF